MDYCQASQTSFHTCLQENQHSLSGKSRLLEYLCCLLLGFAYLSASSFTAFPSGGRVCFEEGFFKSIKLLDACIQK